MKSLHFAQKSVSVFIFTIDRFDAKMSLNLRWTYFKVKVNYGSRLRILGRLSTFLFNNRSITEVKVNASSAGFCCIWSPSLLRSEWPAMQHWCAPRHARRRAEQLTQSCRRQAGAQKSGRGEINPAAVPFQWGKMMKLWFKMRTKQWQDRSRRCRRW